MGNILSDLHGTQGYLKQACTKAIIRNNHLNSLNEKNFKNKQLFELCSNVLGIKDDLLTKDIYLKNSEKAELSSTDKNEIYKWLGIDIVQKFVFSSDRCYVKKETFHSLS